MNTKAPVVIIDQDAHDAECFVNVLRKNAVVDSVVVAADGQHAIDYFESSGASAALRPGLIFTNIAMPRVGGFEVLQWLRSHPGFDSVPAIVFSDSRDPLSIRRAYELGANFYMRKPPSLDRLQDIIRATCAFWGYCLMPEIPVSPSEAKVALRKALHLDWTESAWFNEWLALARGEARHVSPSHS